MSQLTRTTHAASRRRKFTSALLLAICACFLSAIEASAKQDVLDPCTAAMKKNSRDGCIELSTKPGNYPVLIDGQEAGRTTEFARAIVLPPGTYKLTILFPTNRWEHTVNIASRRKECISLNYRERSMNVPRPPVVPCPYPVNVSAPATVNDGDIITFTADVDYEGPSALNYTWTVSPPAARIINGAGTPTITVDSTGLGRRRITAILVVDDGSGDRNCRQTSQSSTSILAPAAPPVQRLRFDEFPSIAFDDDKARLDNFAIELQNNPGSRGYVIAYAGRNSRVGTADGLAARAQNYLVSTRGMDASRIVVINGGYRERNTYELWLVPTGADPPQPSPTVQPGQLLPARTPRPRRRD